MRHTAIALFICSSFMLCSTTAFAQKLNTMEKRHLSTMTGMVSNMEFKVKNAKPDHFDSEDDVGKWERQAAAIRKFKKYNFRGPSKNHPDVAGLLSRVDAAEAQIKGRMLKSSGGSMAMLLTNQEASTIKSVRKNMTQMLQKLERVPQKELSNDTGIKKWRKHQARTTQNVEGLQVKAQNPQVVALNQEVAAFNQKFDEKVGGASKKLDGLNSKFSEFSAIKAKMYKECSSFGNFRNDMTDAERTAWAKGILDARANCGAYYTYMTSVRTEAPHLMTRDELGRGLGRAKPEDAKKLGARDIGPAFGYLHRDPKVNWPLLINFVTKLDPKEDPSQFKEGVVDARKERFARNIRNAKFVISIQDSLFGGEFPDPEGWLKKLEAARDLDLENQQKALELARMCKAKGSQSSAGKLKRLIRKEYPDAKVLKARTASKKVRKNSSRVWTDARTDRTYKVKTSKDVVGLCTLEKEGDKYYVYFYQMSYWRKNAPGYETGKWNISSRSKGYRILKKNMNKRAHK